MTDTRVFGRGCTGEVSVTDFLTTSAVRLDYKARSDDQRRVQDRMINCSQTTTLSHLYYKTLKTAVADRNNQTTKQTESALFSFHCDAIRSLETTEC